MEKNNLCVVVRDIPSGAARRSWTLRADNQGHHHGRIPLSEQPLYLDLKWRATAADEVKQVGVFRLDLVGLLRDGYIRQEASGASTSDVRLRIVRADEGSFYVQANQQGPRFLMSGTSTAQEPQSTNQPAVTSIRVEYADGSADAIRFVHQGVCPLYSLSRKRSDTEMRDLGPHTAGAIAIILFRTALATKRTDYPFNEPKLVEALRLYVEEWSAQRTQEMNNPC